MPRLDRANLPPGFDLSSVRRKETETERLLRKAREEADHLRAANRILVDAMHGGTVA